jgi:DNA-binding response OmpR family regulator
MIIFTSTDGREGLSSAMEKHVDLLLLDIMLPGINGYEICRRLKRDKPDLPIIMITARGSEMDTVAGLDIGADDYITKPFSIPELLARVRAVLRRSSAESAEIESYSFNHVRMDFKKYETWIHQRPVVLSSKEYEIMKYFIEHENEVVHRHDLLEKVWGFDITPSTRTVDNYILELRKKIEVDPTKPRHILTIRGAGYKFVPQP